MPAIRQRAVTRQPSSNPVWRELEDLALRYRAMSADDQTRATERAALREAIYRQMAGTVVRHVMGQAMAAEMAEAAGDGATGASFAAHVDGLFDAAATAQAQATARDSVQLLRRDSPLEAIFRAEAKRLAAQHGGGLAAAHGGATNLAADAQQRLVLERSLNRRTSLLSQWQPERGGSLYTFISRKAASFLIDLARQEFGRKDKGKEGSEQPVRPRMVSIDQPGRSASALNQHDLLDAAAIQQIGDNEELSEQCERELALLAAINQLPDDMRIVAKVVLLQHDDDKLSDEAAAQQAKLPRSTYMRRKQAVVEQLRLMLAGGG